MKAEASITFCLIPLERSRHNVPRASCMSKKDSQWSTLSSRSSIPPSYLTAWEFLYFTGKVRKVHLGTCGKMKDETAKQEAKAMKAAALAIKI